MGQGAEDLDMEWASGRKPTIDRTGSLPNPREGIGLNAAGLYEVWVGGRMIAKAINQHEAASAYWDAKAAQ